MLDGDWQCSVSTEALPAAFPCDFVFFSSILKTEVVSEEDEIFLGPDMSEMLISSEHGTEKPVGFAICSGVRERYSIRLRLVTCRSLALRKVTLAIRKARRATTADNL